MKIHDLSRPLHSALPVWPGDTPYQFELTWRIGPDSCANVGAISTSVHAGTHADAPFHFRDDAPGAAALPLEPFLGPAVVVDVVGIDPICVEHLAERLPEMAPRVLLKTDGWRDTASFPEQIPVMAPDVPAYLAARGVVLVGVDVPSVDVLESTELPIHRALFAHEIQILESLDLSRVAPGPYELIALPLALEGADGSPVRAVLVER